eukprot:15352429-Ditylum_brightwellii.AAC.1
MEEEVLITCQDCQSVPDSSIETAFSATIPGPLYSLGPVNDLRNWLIDSGATSHFILHPEDLRDIGPCQIEVTVADGSTILATCIVPSLCSNKDYTTSISANFTQLDFGDGTTLTLPILKTGNHANASEEATSETQKILSLMPMEMAHLDMGHRSIRSLMVG